MPYSCPDCGWRLPETSYHMSTNDIKEILAHEKTHKEKNG